MVLAGVSAPNVACCGTGRRAARVAALLVASVLGVAGVLGLGVHGVARADSMPWAVGAGSIADDLAIPQNDPAKARGIADDVLARPEYRVPSPTLVQRIQRWVADLVDRVVGALISGGGASFIAWGVLVLAILVVGFLVARFARGVTPDAGRPTSVTSLPLRTATDWRAEAEAHERAGRWRPALRCRYRALVADLAAGGVVDEVPGRTAGEYRAAVNVAAPDVATDFAAVTELFERAWYGRAATSADDAAHLSSLADRVLAGAR